MESSLINDNDNEHLKARIGTLFGSNCRILIGGMVELLESNFKIMKWKKIEDGLVCYIYDFQQNLTFLSLIESNTSSQFECTIHKWTIILDSTMRFEKSSTNFIAVHTNDSKIYGLNFCLKRKAEEFFQMLLLSSIRLHSLHSGMRQKNVDNLLETKSFSSDSFPIEQIEIAHSPRRIFTLLTGLMKKWQHLLSVLQAVLRKLFFRINSFSANKNSQWKFSKYISCIAADKMEQLEISEPVNFEHKIHIGVDSVHGYDENDNDLLRRILHETEQLFDCYSVRTLLAEECSTERKDEKISTERQCNLKNAKDSIRLRSYKQSRRTLSTVKYFDQAKKNGRKSISFENKPHVSLVLLNNQKSGDPEMGHSDKKLAPKYINSKTKNPKRFTGNFGDTFIQKIQQRRERIAEESSEEESGNSEEEW